MKPLITYTSLMAMSILNEGGNYVGKLYDAFTPFTIGIIFLMRLTFDQVGSLSFTMSRLRFQFTNRTLAEAQTLKNLWYVVDFEETIRRSSCSIFDYSA